jgi:glycosyltransferase involved in cell wall biosynthesis
VVATDVGGIPEAVSQPALGRLVPPKSPARLAEALGAQLAAPRLEAQAIARLAAVPSWPESAAALHAVLAEAARDAAAGR